MACHVAAPRFFPKQSGRTSLFAAAFLQGLELTGARPKELAEAEAADFDGQALRLVHRKGRPPKLRIRYTVSAWMA